MTARGKAMGGSLAATVLMIRATNTIVPGDVVVEVQTAAVAMTAGC